MIVQHFGDVISLVLVLIAFVLFFLGMYVAYKYSDNMSPAHKGLKLHLNYNVFSVASFSLAFFVFWVSNNGFSWDALLFSLGLMVASSVLFTLNYLISLGTATYLKHRKVSLPPLLGQRIIQHFNRKTALKKGTAKGNKED